MIERPAQPHNIIIAIQLKHLPSAKAKTILIYAFFKTNSRKFFFTSICSNSKTKNIKKIQHIFIIYWLSTQYSIYFKLIDIVFNKYFQIRASFFFSRLSVNNYKSKKAPENYFSEAFALVSYFDNCLRFCFIICAVITGKNISFTHPAQLFSNFFIIKL